MQLTDAFYPKRLALHSKFISSCISRESHPWPWSTAEAYMCVFVSGMTGILMCAAGLPVCLTRAPKPILHPPAISKSDLKPVPGINSIRRKTKKKHLRKGEHVCVCVCVCVCVFVQPLILCRTVFADLRLRVNRATTESDMVPESCHHRSA